MEELCLEKVRPVHVPGPANVLADYLSRPEKMKKAPLPAVLKDVKVITAEVRSDSYFQLPLPKNSPSLWVRKCCRHTQCGILYNEDEKQKGLARGLINRSEVVG